MAGKHVNDLLGKIMAITIDRHEKRITAIEETTLTMHKVTTSLDPFQISRIMGTMQKTLEKFTTRIDIFQPRGILKDVEDELLCKVRHRQPECLCKRFVNLNWEGIYRRQEQLAEIALGMTIQLMSFREIAKFVKAVPSISRLPYPGSPEFGAQTAEVKLLGTPLRELSKHLVVRIFRRKISHSTDHQFANRGSKFRLY